MNEHGLSDLPSLQRAQHFSDDAKTLTGIVQSSSRPWFVVKLDRPLVVTSGVVGDFNGNAELDLEDLDLLAAELQSERDVRLFDVNADKMVDFADRQFWVEELANTFFGDANLDKQVDFADFLALTAGFGQKGSWAEGDFDGDGQIKFEDFLLLSDNLGKVAISGAAVPEPSSAALLLAGIASRQRESERCRKPHSAIGH